MSDMTSIRNAHIVSQQPLTLESALVRGVLVDLDAFHAVTPLVSFRVQWMGGNLYDYEFIAVDTRTWLQSLDIPVSGEERQTFNIPTYWKKSEFSLQWSLRDTVVALVKSHGLTLFRVDYS